MAITLIKSGKKKGHYRVRIQPVDRTTGKTIKIPSVITNGTTRSEAVNLETKLWAKFHDEVKIENQMLDQPLSEAFQKYVDECHDNDRWEDSTYYDWQYTAKLIKKFFGRQKIKDVREADVNSFAHDYVKKHKTRVAKHTTIDRQLQNIRSFFNKMRQYGLTVNPVPESALSQFFRKGDMTIPDKKYVFTSDEVNAIRTTLFAELKNTPFIYWGSRLAILIALDTGMRPQEIQALRWDEFTKEGGFTVLSIDDSWCERSKKFNGHLKARMHGESRKTLSISSELLDVLKDYHQKQESILNRKKLVNDNNLVLLNLTDFVRCSEGLPIAQRTMNDMLKRTAKKVEVNNGSLAVTMYTCRHTVATKLGNTPNMSYPWAASRLGHSLQMFMRTYVHPDKDLNQSMLELAVTANNQIENFRVFTKHTNWRHAK